MTAVPLWLIENVRLPDREGLWQIAIDKGCFGDITPMGDARSESYEVLNARGGLASPPFIEPHSHLDTTQTAGEPNWNQSGTLFEGIERWAERKALLSHEDVKARAWKTLKWQIGNGIQFVRTHVDVSDPTLTALNDFFYITAYLNDSAATLIDANQLHLYLLLKWYVYDLSVFL